MSKICQLTGTRPLKGHNVSHSNRKTNRRFNPNLQNKRIYIPEVDKWIKVKLTTKALRTIEKVGAYTFLKQQVAAGFDPKVWSENKAQQDAIKKAKRGYRRVEVIDNNGNKSYAITYEPAVVNNRKVRLSSVLK